MNGFEYFSYRKKPRPPRLRRMAELNEHFAQIEQQKEKEIMAKLVFNAANVEPAGMSSMLPVSGPEGLPVIISASEIKENAAKDGGYLELTLTVIDGDHRGESGAYRLNLYHKNEKTVEIAYRQLSAVCHVVNVFNVADTQQLHNIPFRAIVGLQKRKVDWKEGDAEYTEVKGVLHADGSQPGKSKSGGNSGSALVVPTTPPVPADIPTTVVAPEPSAPPTWGAPTAGAATSSAPPWAQPK